MSDSFDVSVIIPTYNEGEKVAQCVAALQAQEFSGSFEVIVVDNGSTKNLPEVPSGDARFRMIREPTPGSYAARNSGLRIARGQIIAFTDSDCLPDPRWLEAAVAHLSREADAALLAGRIDVFFADPESPTPVELFERRFAFKQKESVRQGWAVTANLIVRRAVFDGVGEFDTRTFSGGDSEFTKRAVAAGFALRYADEAIVRHPARSSLSELSQMRRRHVGGFYRLSKSQPEFAEMFSMSGVLKDFLYPAKGAVLLGADLLHGRVAFGEAIKVMMVLTHTRVYRGWLKLLYRFGLKRSYERA
ncbi:glycosyltransferase [Luteimonas sp. FCS-9]|uniref:glycosyltransferase n=1 Tax=Luteimonas sp. FCS-9 TaxID=1547516 RepID=UPI0009E516FB|nr:glycosyltransferase [Luteimonas sp. FCS-9]